MTPNRFLLGLISMLLLVGLTAEADFAVTPLNPGGVVPGPTRPLPPPSPGPGHPGNPGHPGQGGRFQKEIYLGRYITNEALPLRQLAGLGREFEGYNVESVRVETRPAGYYANLELVVNGRVEASSSSNGSNVTLRPRGYSPLGRDVQSLRLRVQGTAYIDRIVIVLASNGGGYPGPGPGPGPRPPYPPPYPGPQPQPNVVSLPIHLNVRAYGDQRIDLAGYVNLSGYRGYRLQAIEVRGQAVYNNALVDLLTNGYYAGQVELNFRGQNGGVVYPQHRVIIGQGGDQVSLLVRGEAVIQTVILHLQR